MNTDFVVCFCLRIVATLKVKVNFYPLNCVGICERVGTWLVLHHIFTIFIPDRLFPVIPSNYLANSHRGRTQCPWTLPLKWRPTLVSKFPTCLDPNSSSWTSTHWGFLVLLFSKYVRHGEIKFQLGALRRTVFAILTKSPTVELSSVQTSWDHGIFIRLVMLQILTIME